MIRVLIDQGHGEGKNFNRGGVCFNEGDNNFHYSAVLKSEIEMYEGVKVDLTRNKISDNPSLTARSNMGKGYDLFISEHSNAHDGIVRGSEVWDSVEKPNKALAQALVDVTANLFNHTNRGVKYKAGQPGYNWYSVLRFNGAKSAMIVENGFHDNPLDCAFFKNNHQKLAKAQAKVIADHYKLKRKDVIDVSKPSKAHESDWNLGIKMGLTDGTNPRMDITREQVVTIVLRALGITSKTNNSNEHWANKDLIKLLDNGMNINDKRFNEFVKRGELFKLLNDDRGVK